MSLSRAFAACAVFGLAGLVGIACNSSPPTPTQEVPVTCSPGDSCTCSDTCQRVCLGEGCYFQCNAGDCGLSCPNGQCHAYVEGATATELGCADGGCSLETSGDGTYSVTCPGGGCGAYCTGATACKILECTHDCTLRCTGVLDGGCQNSCPDSGPDENNCITFIE